MGRSGQKSALNAFTSTSPAPDGIDFCAAVVGLGWRSAERPAPGIGGPPWLVAPDGVTMSGKALSTTGIRTSWLVPDHALVLEVTRVPSNALRTAPTRPTPTRRSGRRWRT